MNKVGYGWWHGTILVERLNECITISRGGDSPLEGMLSMVVIECDMITRRISTQVTTGEIQSNRRYDMQHLSAENWDSLVALLHEAEQANWILPEYSRFLDWLKRQYTGKILDSSVYRVFGGLMRDLERIDDTLIIVSG